MVAFVFVRANGAATGQRGRRRLPVLVTAALIVGPLAAGPLAASAAAQRQRVVPSVRYHAAFAEFYDGQYADALEEFRDEGRRAIKTPQSRWIDSICYETMNGECYYHMGDLPRALEHYTAALELYAAFYNWMQWLQLPPPIRPAAARRQIPWGASTRGARLGHYPATMLIGQGQINVSEQIERGGVIQQALLYPIQVQEIVRCTTLAMRRRAKLLGPVCRHDPLTSRLYTALSRRPGLPNHWTEAWIDVQLGLAAAAAGKQDQAARHLRRAVLAAGQYDHPLTSTALLELGRLALSRANYATASNFFAEATYAAVHYPDAGVLEDAFRYATLTHIVANRRGVYPPLAPAILWAKANNLRKLHASLLLSAAENYATLGQTAAAARLLDEARLGLGRRRQMAAGRIGTRLNFLSALVFFQQKKVAQGNTALAAAMGAMRQGSYWLFHISMADGLYRSGSITARTAMELYGDVLRDPQPADWASDPMESMAVLVTPHPLPIEHWFEVAMEGRKEYESALEIADRARRHRFYSSLAFGGRLQSLRWILEGPAEMLDQQSQLLRRDLLARYPVYDRLARQTKAIHAALAGAPLVAEDSEALQTQSRALDQVASLSLQQEAILREMAVRREPAGLVFPPLRETSEIQRSLPEGHAMLAFFATRRRMYVFLLNNKDYGHWTVGSLPALSKGIVALLRDMGQMQRNHELLPKDLADTAWKQSARQVLDTLLEGSRADFSQPLDELIIVPDGVLWYLPFEALQVDVGGKLRPLISRFRIRYAPTASLAMSMRGGRKPAARTAVVVGRLSPRDDAAVAEAAFERLAKSVPAAVALKSPLPAPSSVYATLFDRLVVLDDVGQSAQGPYGWAPVTIGGAKPGNLLGDWLALPWGGPDEIVLPGFHTAAENSLKQVNRAAPGSEVFLSVCGLMSSGTRTLLLSRWRSGGQSSFEIVREFVQELPHTSPAEAWQRAVFLTVGSRLNLEAEPRIKHTTDAESPRASHPFFWAGYMLVDSGVAGDRDNAAAGIPALNPGKPDEK